MLAPWKKSYDQPSIVKEQRHDFADKGPSSQSYGFSSSHVWMWELDYKESWELKNWYLGTMVLEKTLESPLDCKKIQLVHPKGKQSWIFTGRIDAEAEVPILWPPDANNWLLGKDPDAGKDWRQEEKGTTEDEMAGWHHQLNRHEFGWSPGVGYGQGDLACCSLWAAKIGRDWVTELNWMTKVTHYFPTEKSCLFFMSWVNLSTIRLCLDIFAGLVAFSSQLTSHYLIMGSEISIQLYLGILAPVILWRFLCNFHPASSFLNQGPSLLWFIALWLDF